MGDRTTGILVPYASDRMTRRVDVEAVQRGEPARHDALAAGLVDLACSRLEHDGLEAAALELESEDEADRAAARDHDIDVGRDHEAVRSAASARFSTGMRKPRSSTALSTVNTSAVTHAVWTSGSATPSIATIQ